MGRKALDKTTEMSTKVVVHNTDWRLSKMILVDKYVHIWKEEILRQSSSPINNPNTINILLLFLT